MSDKDNFVIEGNNLRLRKVVIADVNDNYYRWMNDPDVNKYMETRFNHQSIKDIEQYVQRMNEDPDGLFMAIIHKDNDLHIGNIKLGPISEVHRRGELSFFIGDKQFWGKGFATEAVGLLTDYGIRKLGLLKVTAGCYSNNMAAQRVFTKLGYIVEGIWERHYICEDEMVDRICYARFNNQGDILNDLRQ